MSADAAPISPARFAEALKDLPIGSLHEKAAELRNSIGHLKSSNEQIRDYLLAQPPDAPADADCVEAIQENVQVIKRMEERVELVKAEVQERGLPWPNEDDAQDIELDQLEPGETRAAAPLVNGDHGLQTSRSGVGETRQTSGSLTDAELQRRLAERLAAPDEGQSDEEAGVHL